MRRIPRDFEQVLTFIAALPARDLGGVAGRIQRIAIIEGCARIACRDRELCLRNGERIGIPADEFIISRLFARAERDRDRPFARIGCIVCTLCAHEGCVLRVGIDVVDHVRTKLVGRRNADRNSFAVIRLVDGRHIKCNFFLLDRQRGGKRCYVRISVVCKQFASVKLCDRDIVFAHRAVCRTGCIVRTILLCCKDGREVSCEILAVHPAAVCKGIGGYLLAVDGRICAFFECDRKICLSDRELCRSVRRKNIIVRLRTRAERDRDPPFARIGCAIRRRPFKCAAAPCIGIGIDNLVRTKLVGRRNADRNGSAVIRLVASLHGERNSFWLDRQRPCAQIGKVVVIGCEACGGDIVCTDVAARLIACALSAVSIRHARSIDIVCALVLPVLPALIDKRICGRVLAVGDRFIFDPNGELCLCDVELRRRFGERIVLVGDGDRDGVFFDVFGHNRTRFAVRVSDAEQIERIRRAASAGSLQAARRNRCRLRRTVDGSICAVFELFARKRERDLRRLDGEGDCLDICCIVGLIACCQNKYGVIFARMRRGSYDLVLNGVFLTIRLPPAVIRFIIRRTVVIDGNSHVIQVIAAVIDGCFCRTAICPECIAVKTEADSSIVKKCLCDLIPQPNHIFRYAVGSVVFRRMRERRHFPDIVVCIEQCQRKPVNTVVGAVCRFKVKPYDIADIDAMQSFRSIKYHRRLLNCAIILDITRVLCLRYFEERIPDNFARNKSILADFERLGSVFKSLDRIIRNRFARNAADRDRILPDIDGCGIACVGKAHLARIDREQIGNRRRRRLCGVIEGVMIPLFILRRRIPRHGDAIGRNGDRELRIGARILPDKVIGRKRDNNFIRARMKRRKRSLRRIKSDSHVRSLSIFEDKRTDIGLIVSAIPVFKREDIVFAPIGDLSLPFAGKRSGRGERKFFNREGKRRHGIPVRPLVVCIRRERHGIGACIFLHIFRDGIEIDSDARIPFGQSRDVLSVIIGVIAICSARISRLRRHGERCAFDDKQRIDRYIKSAFGKRIFAPAIVIAVKRKRNGITCLVGSRLRGGRNRVRDACVLGKVVIVLFPVPGDGLLCARDGDAEARDLPDKRERLPAYTCKFIVPYIVVRERDDDGIAVRSAPMLRRQVSAAHCQLALNRTRRGHDFAHGIACHIVLNGCAHPVGREHAISRKHRRRLNGLGRNGPGHFRWRAFSV